MTLTTIAAPPAKSALPPKAPHDPRDRELVLAFEDWEVRAFSSRWFGFFAPRGLWHVQLWHPEKLVSILTPSRLTRGAYELSPSPAAGSASPVRATSYEVIASAVAAEHGASAPTIERMAWVESVFVRRVTELTGPPH